MSDVVRVGVVGLGFMGQTHVAAYQSADGATLVAVADADEARRTGHASTGGNLDSGASADRLFDPEAVRGYATAEELFADDDVDLVSICTPTPSHVDLAAAAMRAGKHVLVEKPVAVDTRQIEKLAG
ncbi:MAG: Gfo/Idh/MocA family oxidoreductase, partial [Planctomycetota bacterium]